MSQDRMNGFISTGDDDSRSSHDQTCCLIDNGRRCTRPAGNASYSKRIQKTVQQRKLKLNIDQNVRHIYICDDHKNQIQNLRAKRKRTDSYGDSGDEYDQSDVDFFSMPLNTLRRYKKFYKIPTRPGLNKAQLADMVARHFHTITVSEKETLTYFIYMAKSNQSRLDQKHAADFI